MNKSTKLLNGLFIVLFLTYPLSLSVNSSSNLIPSENSVSLNPKDPYFPSKMAIQPLSGLSQSGSPHGLLPVSILVYTEFSDNEGPSEWKNTMNAIDATYGSDYYYANLTDYTRIASELPNYDILLIPEQENADTATMKMVGTVWAKTLAEFAENGGIVILMAYGVFYQNFGQTTHIYNESGLLKINSYSNLTTGSTINLINTDNALARDIASSWSAPSGSLCFDTSDGTTIADNGTHPVIIHKVLGQGHVVLLGFDLATHESNSAKILGNAIRLHRHVVFDYSHTQIYTISESYSAFAADLTAKGFAVSNMADFSLSLLNASDTLIISPGGTPYTTDEIIAIKAFVEQGGGLFALSEWGGAGDEVDPILNTFGFYRNETAFLTDSDDNSGTSSNIDYTESNLANHSLTIGAARIEQYAGTGFRQIPTEAQSIITTDTDSTAFWNATNAAASVTSYATMIYGTGRIALGLDADFLSNSTDTDLDSTNNYEDSDNALLGLNTIRWLSAAGIKERIVLFDDSHDPLHPVSALTGYAGFANYLTSNGYTVRWMDPFNENLLEEVHSLVVCDGSANYTSLEIEAIEAFVASGGGLFLVGDHDAGSSQVDPIGREFGININNTGILQDSDDNVGLPTYIAYTPENSGDHVITDKISRIELYNGSAFDTISNGSAIFFTDSDGTCTWNNGGIANKTAVIAAIEHQVGRVVFIAESNFLQAGIDSDGDGTANFYDSDNNLLAMNIFQWLTENRAPIVTVLSPNGGEIFANRQVINWTAIDPNKDLMAYDLHYSSDSSTWISLASELSNTSYEWETSSVVDSDQYILRVSATDGLLSGQDESDNVFVIDNHGPSILNVQNDSAAVNISAEVTDISGVASVFLNFTIDDSTTWNAAPMEKNSGNIYYFSTEELIIGTTVKYKIIATDNSPFHHTSITNFYNFTVEQVASSTSTSSATREADLGQIIILAVIIGGIGIVIPAVLIARQKRLKL
ncbi:MAG: DUF4350 domain-containing protein [Candidatus Hodarchaeota archaeon]